MKEGWSGALLRLVAYALLPTMALLVATEVFFRYVLSSPLGWSEEVISAALLASFVGALPYCIRVDSHVKVETLYELMGQRSKSWVDLLSGLCGAVFMGALALGSGRETIGMYSRQEVTEIAGLPQWPLAAFLTLVSVGSAAWLLWRGVASLRRTGQS